MSKKIDDMISDSMMLERSFVYALLLLKNNNIRSNSKLVRVLKDKENKLTTLKFIQHFLEKSSLEVCFFSIHENAEVRCYVDRDQPLNKGHLTKRQVVCNKSKKLYRNYGK